MNALEQGRKAGMHGVDRRACPALRYEIVKRCLWLRGWHEGATTRHLIRAHERNVYHTDHAHYSALWF